MGLRLSFVLESSFVLHCWRNVSNAAFPHDSPLTIALFARLMASLASVNPYSGGAQPVRVTTI